MRFLQIYSISRVDKYDEFWNSIKSKNISKAKEIMQHLYGLSATIILTPNTNTSVTNKLSIATDDMTLSNELQIAISTVSVVQTSNTTKEFVFGSLQTDVNLFETSGVRTLATQCLMYHTANINRQ
jgi:hypothetical protein